MEVRDFVTAFHSQHLISHQPSSKLHCTGGNSVFIKHEITQIYRQDFVLQGSTSVSTQRSVAGRHLLQYEQKWKQDSFANTTLPDIKFDGAQQLQDTGLPKVRPGQPDPSL